MSITKEIRNKTRAFHWKALTFVLCCVGTAASSAEAASGARPIDPIQVRALCEKNALDGQQYPRIKSGSRVMPPSFPEMSKEISIEAACASYVFNLEQRFSEAKDLRLLNRVSDLSDDAQVRIRAALPMGNPALPALVDFGANAARLDSNGIDKLPIAQHLFSLESDRLAAVLFRRGGEKAVVLVLADKTSTLFCMYTLSLEVGDFSVLSMQQLFIGNDVPTCSLRVISLEQSRN